MVRPRHRNLALGMSAALLAGLLSACGGSGGPPTLTWYINPDNGGQAALAKECTTAAHGAYKISTSLLPVDATQQRQQLVTRLSAKDSSISLMSVDPVYVPELSQAGFLAPIPQSSVAGLTKDIFPSAVQAATWRGKLVAAPFFANVQLLWYQKSVAKAAGLDMSKPVTWDQIIDAAAKTRKTVAVQADQYEGYTVLINAIILGAGGKIVESVGKEPKDTKLGLDSPAGEQAARIIREIVQKRVGGPALSTSEENPSLDLFKSSTGGFMVNYPFVWAALKPKQKQGVGFTVYPQTVAGRASKPPFGGIDIAVGKYSSHRTQALSALSCLTSAAHQAQYMAAEGNPAANSTVYSQPAITKAFPNGLASMIKTSLSRSGPRPQSQYYGDLSAALQKSFSPPNSVSSSTPDQAQKFILAVLKGDKLL